MQQDCFGFHFLGCYGSSVRHKQNAIDSFVQFHQVSLRNEALSVTEDIFYIIQSCGRPNRLICYQGFVFSFDIIHEPTEVFTH